MASVIIIDTFDLLEGEKKKLVEEFSQEVADYLQIEESVKLIIDKENDHEYGAMHLGTNTITLYGVRDNEIIRETIAHEMRHVYQQQIGSHLIIPSSLNEYNLSWQEVDANVFAMWFTYYKLLGDIMPHIPTDEEIYNYAAESITNCQYNENGDCKCIDNDVCDADGDIGTYCMSMLSPMEQVNSMFRKRYSESLAYRNVDAFMSRLALEEV